MLEIGRRAMLKELSLFPNSQNRAFAMDILRTNKMIEIGRRKSKMVWEGVSPETSSRNGDA